MKNGFGIFTAILVGIALVGGCSHAVPALSTDEFSSSWSADSTHVLVDVRTNAELDSTGYIAGAIHIPIKDLEAEPDRALEFSGKTVVVYCRTGGRATRGVRLLRSRGIEAYNLEGGMRKWISEGRPTVQTVREKD